MDLADRTYEHTVRAPALPQRKWDLVTMPLLAGGLISVVAFTIWIIVNNWPIK